MSTRLSVAIVWVVGIGTITAAVYEISALATGSITISRYLRTLAEAYHLVYILAGVILGFLFLIALGAPHLPIIIRAAVLAWLFIFGHIFWGFC